MAACGLKPASALLHVARVASSSTLKSTRSLGLSHISQRLLRPAARLCKPLQAAPLSPPASRAPFRRPAFPSIVKRHMAAQGQSEEAAAAAAAPVADKELPTIFDKIVSKEIPATLVYEDDKVLAFRDISPQAPVHVILIPKERDGLTRLSKAEARHKEILGHLLLTASQIAHQEGLAPDGFRVVINDGPQGSQSVYHLHVHILGGRQMTWPPG